MSAKKTTEIPAANLLAEEEEYAPLVYNMWIDGGVTINMAENSTVIFQTGKAPVDNDPPPGNP